MAMVDIRDHVWGFGKCMIRPVGFDYFAASYEAHLHVSGKLGYSPVFNEVVDKLTGDIYRFPKGFKVSVEMSEIKLFNSEANANENGAMKTLVEKLFPAINIQMANGVYPIFDMMINVPEAGTWGSGDNTNYVMLNDMYLDSDITIDQLKKHGMYGQTFNLKFIGKSLVNSIPLALTGYGYVITASNAGTDYVITYSEDSVDYAIKIY
jgi:hypothetical protein